MRNMFQQLSHRERIQALGPELQTWSSDNLERMAATTSWRCLGDKPPRDAIVISRKKGNALIKTQILLFLFRSNKRDIASAHSLSSYHRLTHWCDGCQQDINHWLHPWANASCETPVWRPDWILPKYLRISCAHTLAHSYSSWEDMSPSTEAAKRNQPSELISSTDVNVKLKIRLRSEPVSLCVVTTKPFILSQHGCVMVCGNVSAPAWVQSSPWERRWWLSPHAKSCRSLQSIGLRSEMLRAGWNVTVSHEGSDRLICCEWLPVNILFKWKPQRKY